MQTVVRADGFRGVAGTLVTGQLARRRRGVGRGIRRRRVGSAGSLVAGVDRDRATAGDAVAVELLPDLDVTRGDLLESAPAIRWSRRTGSPPTSSGSARSRWPTAGRTCSSCGPLVVPAVVTSVRHRLDVTTGSEEAARVLSLNDVGRVEVATDRPVPDRGRTCTAATPAGSCSSTGSPPTRWPPGMVRYALRRSANVRSHEFVVDRAARERLNGHHGRVLWLTGLSGSGKSTIADAVERDLHAQGVRTFVLDGDNVRHGLNKDLGFTPEDRAENVRRVAEVARLMVESGTVVIVALVSPFRGDRRAARDLFDPGDFVEVFVSTPVEVVRCQRDPKGLYAKAASGELPNLTGVGQDYEEPLTPDLVVAGDGDLAESVSSRRRGRRPGAGAAGVRSRAPVPIRGSTPLWTGADRRWPSLRRQTRSAFRLFPTIPIGYGSVHAPHGSCLRPRRRRRPDGGRHPRDGLRSHLGHPADAAGLLGRGGVRGHPRGEDGHHVRLGHQPLARGERRLPGDGGHRGARRDRRASSGR